MSADELDAMLADHVLTAGSSAAGGANVLSADLSGSVVRDAIADYLLQSYGPDLSYEDFQAGFAKLGLASPIASKEEYALLAGAYRGKGQTTLDADSLKTLIGSAVNFSVDAKTGKTKAALNTQDALLIDALLPTLFPNGATTIDTDALRARLKALGIDVALSDEDLKALARNYTGTDATALTQSQLRQMLSECGVDLKQPAKTHRYDLTTNTGALSNRTEYDFTPSGAINLINGDDGNTQLNGAAVTIDTTDPNNVTVNGEKVTQFSYGYLDNANGTRGDAVIVLQTAGGRYVVNAKQSPGLAAKLATHLYSDIPTVSDLYNLQSSESGKTIVQKSMEDLINYYTELEKEGRLTDEQKKLLLAVRAKSMSDHGFEADKIGADDDLDPAAAKTMFDDGKIQAAIDEAMQDPQVQQDLVDFLQRNLHATSDPNAAALADKLLAATKDASLGDLHDWLETNIGKGVGDVKTGSIVNTLALLDSYKAAKAMGVLAVNISAGQYNNATLANTDSQDVQVAVSDILKAIRSGGRFFGLGTGTVDEFADLLKKWSADHGGSIDQLAEALAKGLRDASAAGVDIKDATAMAQFFDKAGLRDVGDFVSKLNSKGAWSVFAGLASIGSFIYKVAKANHTPYQRLSAANDFITATSYLNGYFKAVDYFRPFMAAMGLDKTPHQLYQYLKAQNDDAIERSINVINRVGGPKNVNAIKEILYRTNFEGDIEQAARAISQQLEAGTATDASVRDILGQYRDVPASSAMPAMDRLADELQGKNLADADEVYRALKAAGFQGSDEELRAIASKLAEKAAALAPEQRVITDITEADDFLKGAIRDLITPENTAWDGLMANALNDRLDTLTEALKGKNLLDEGVVTQALRDAGFTGTDAELQTIAKSFIEQVKTANNVGGDPLSTYTLNDETVLRNTVDDTFTSMLLDTEHSPDTVGIIEKQLKMETISTRIDSLSGALVNVNLRDEAAVAQALLAKGVSAEEAQVLAREIAAKAQTMSGETVQFADAAGVKSVVEQAAQQINAEIVQSVRALGRPVTLTEAITLLRNGGFQGDVVAAATNLSELTPSQLANEGSVAAILNAAAGKAPSVDSAKTWFSTVLTADVNLKDSQAIAAALKAQNYLGLSDATIEQMARNLAAKASAPALSGAGNTQVIDGFFGDAAGNLALRDFYNASARAAVTGGTFGAGSIPQFSFAVEAAGTEAAAATEAAIRASTLAEIKGITGTVSSARAIGSLVLRSIGVGADVVGGPIGIALGALQIRDARDAGDKAAGSLGIVSGTLQLAAGLAGFAGFAGALVGAETAAALATLATPLFFVGIVIGIVGLFVGLFAHKHQKSPEEQVQDSLQPYADAGFMKDDWQQQLHNWYDAHG
ncbi:MAG: hypothetical protein ACTHKB_10445 [Burkholderiaceae bacterium]